MRSVITEPDTDFCPECNEAFRSVKSHWNKSSSCSNPKFPKELKEILKGILATKGTFNEQSGGKVQISVSSSNIGKLEELWHVFGCYSNKISKTYHESTNSTVYTLNLSPINEVQSESDLDNVPFTLLAQKALFTIRSVIVERDKQWTIGVPAAQARYTTELNELFNWSGEQENKYTYYMPCEDMPEFSEVDWPCGWWNKQYLD